MRYIIDIPEDVFKRTVFYREFRDLNDCVTTIKALENGIPLDDLLQRLRKRISDLYNTDVTYDNGDYNTMDTPTLDKVLEYFDSEVQE